MGINGIVKRGTKTIYGEDKMEDIKQIIDKIGETKGWSKSTRMIYRSVLKGYLKYQQMTLQELIDEAYQEEEDKTPHHRLTLRRRLIEYFDYLKSQGKSYNTLASTKRGIVNVYKYYGVKIPDLVGFTGKQFTHNPRMSLEYEDIITREEIQELLEVASLNMKALILFSCSSGTALNEVLHITIQDYINATYEYHQQRQYNHESDTTYLQRVINKLIEKQENTDIVPTFKLIRRKTAKPYYTFCTPETSKAICQMLDDRIVDHKIKLTDRLFGMGRTTIYRHLNQLENICHIGKAGRYKKTTVHMFRRYFATTMANTSDGTYEDIMPEYLIDECEGRSSNKINKVYIKKNPKQLKEQYTKYMSKVYLTKEHEIEQLKKQVKEDAEVQRQLDSMKHMIQELSESVDHKSVDSYVW